MKEQKQNLSVYCLTQALCDTEWTALAGHKYMDAVPFRLQFVDDPGQAEVIAWNGLLTPKSVHAYEPLLARLKAGAVLLLMGEGRTLLQSHPFVKEAALSDFKVVELSGWSVLPEEILQALNLCREKLKHV